MSIYVRINVVIVTCLVAAAAYAADADRLVTAFEQMYNSEIDTLTTRAVTDLRIEHEDLILMLDSGRVAFCRPVVIDSESYVYGGYFEGRGRFRFRPSTGIERNHMERVTGADSLDRTIRKAYFLFSDDVHRYITAGSQPAPTLFGKDHIERARDRLEQLTDDETYYYIFTTLRNLVEPHDRPYLLINTDLGDYSRVYYKFDPLRREEVTFSRYFQEVGRQFMEMVCSYSQYIDTNYININGQSKAGLSFDHYMIDATIDNNGNFVAVTEATATILAPVQMFRLSLHPELLVDSIVNASGAPVRFIRYKKDKHKSSSLYLVLNRPYVPDETLVLTFYYGGEISKRRILTYYVTAGADWYPRYSGHDQATFDLTFKTPGDKDIEFVATGRLANSRRTGDTLFSHWVVDEPARNVSFSIGFMKKYEFTDGDVPPVEVYFEESVHQDLARELSADMVGTGKHMERQVAEDITNAMRLFSHYFGPCPYDRIRVSEIMAMHGESFPGFIHMGIPTWINTDSYGHQRGFRAHEVAHQWWGVTVGYETYHDAWLSEAFAEYCALMYVQAVLGNDKFLDLLEENRKEIFSVRKYLLGSGPESGPIALGYRASSTETAGDYGLVIYRKGAMVLHMLRNMMIDFTTMNEDAFFAMMREFYTTYRGKQASTLNFIELVERYVGEDMGWFFDQWVYGTDLPKYKFSYDYEQDDQGLYTARCRIVTEGVEPDFKMYVPLEIKIDDDRTAYLRLFIDQPDFTFTLPGLPHKAKDLRLNPFESVLAEVDQ